MRKIHLYTGLGLLAFLVMYFVTGFVMISHDMFPGGEPDRQTRTVAVEIPSGLDLERTGDWIADNLELGGKPQPPQTLDDGRVRYRYNRPGIGFVAHLSADRSSVEVERSDFGFRGMMNGYHRMHGYSGGFLWVLWALMYDLASAGCIVFALSGVWVWAAGAERDRVSWFMLAAGLGFTAAMILYLMLAR